MDHIPCDTQARFVHPSPLADHERDDTRQLFVRLDLADHDVSDDHESHVGRCVASLAEATRFYKQFQTAELRLTNQIKAVARTMGGHPKGDDHHPSAVLLAEAITLPLVEARDGLRKHKTTHAKRIVALARQLPVWPWIEAQRGVGALGFGLIVGETGNLSEYANPAKLWKRMGLAVEKDGKAQRRIKGTVKGILAGFSPRRRALMHVIGDALLKLNKGDYRRSYDERKAYELARGIQKMHAHKRALRYMEKKFLKDLWRTWRTI